ncbi:MAG: hypothetical protein AAF938_24865, partial [Myxococcota bacterium]
ALLGGALAHAQVCALPWASRPAAVCGDAIVAFAHSGGDPRITRFSARRASARRLARESGQRSLRAFVDEALAGVLAQPDQAAAVHRVVERELREGRARALVEGGVVLELKVPRAGLRAAWPAAPTSLPW